MRGGSWYNSRPSRPRPAERYDLPLTTRHLQPELMDNQGLDTQSHQRALRGLARLNRWSRSAEILWKPIERLAAARPGETLSLLDVASGAGDLAIALDHRAAARGLQLEIVGCDISETAVDHARSAARKRNAGVRFEVRDILENPPEEKFDIVTCSLFLHHLAEEQALHLLRTLAAVARQIVLVNDLARSLPGYALAQVACHTLSRSPVVHVDGPRSVEGAFTIGEARGLCVKAGLAGAVVSPRWPCRFLIEWRPKHAS